MSGCYRTEMHTKSYVSIYLPIEQKKIHTCSIQLSKRKFIPVLFIHERYSLIFLFDKTYAVLFQEF